MLQEFYGVDLGYTYSYRPTPYSDDLEATISKGLKLGLWKTKARKIGGIGFWESLFVVTLPVIEDSDKRIIPTIAKLLTPFKNKLNLFNVVALVYYQRSTHKVSNSSLRDFFYWYHTRYTEAELNEGLRLLAELEAKEKRNENY